MAHHILLLALLAVTRLRCGSLYLPEKSYGLVFVIVNSPWLVWLLYAKPCHHLPAGRQVGIGGFGMRYQVMFIVYRILHIVSYLHNIFYNEDAPAVGIGGTDLFVCGVI